VTSTGQKVIKTNEKIVNDFFLNDFFNLKVIKDKFKIKEDYDIGQTSVYIDTDSIYMSFEKVLTKMGIDTTNKALSLKVVKGVLEKILNKMFDKWNIDHSRYAFNADNKIIFEREIIADSTLFIEKKRYCCHVVDNEGKAVDKLKVTGMEIVRSSTPKLVKGFLKAIVEEILKQGDYDHAKKTLIDFYDRFNDGKIHEISFPRTVNNIEKWLVEKDGKPIPVDGYRKSTPVHVKASILHNRLVEKYGLSDIEPIRGGDKIKFVSLITGGTQYEEVIAYKNDKLPKEFKYHDCIDVWQQWEKTMVKPLEPIFNAMGWLLPNFSVNDLDDLFE
jgi:DNA polymerase elongation subunit (family B)